MSDVVRWLLTLAAAFSLFGFGVRFSSGFDIESGALLVAFILALGFIGLLSDRDNG